MSELDGKVAIITGGAGGIGAATAALMAARGARVVLADIDRAGAEAAAARLGQGRALALPLDLADEASVRAMIERTLAAFGRLDILHANAADLSADTSARDRDVETMDPDLWDRTFRINVRGTMLSCKHALPAMVRQGGGAIIVTASNLGLQGNVVQAAYSASKAALLQLVRSIAASHGRAGIRCNAVSPGLTMTRAAQEHLPPAIFAAVADETLTPFLGEPQDIAEAVAFLASDAARAITGHNLVVDGGLASHVPGFPALRAATAR